MPKSSNYNNSRGLESPILNSKNPTLEFAVSSQQGMRPYQEDEVAIQSYKSPESNDNPYEEEKALTRDSVLETFLFGKHLLTFIK